MKFDKYLLEDIRRQIKISEVVAPRVTWSRKSNPGRGDFWACCPLHGEASPSFHCLDGKGMWHCFGCGASGDHFKFLTELDGISFPRAVARVAAMAGINIDRGEETPEEIARREKRAAELEQRRQADLAEAERDRQRRIGTAGGIWKGSLALADTPADVYLRSRGIALPNEPNLRFHPGLPLHGKGSHPALIGRVQDAEGKGTSVWRIYLDQAGRALLDEDGKKLKIGFGPARGGAVRLFSEIDEEIGIGEGIESCVSAYIIDPRRPIWAGLSTSGIMSFEPPAFVKSVRIFPDGDAHKRRNGVDHGPAGMLAAIKLKERLDASGRVHCEIVPPPDNGDWNDVLQSVAQTSFWR